ITPLRKAGKVVPATVSFLCFRQNRSMKMSRLNGLNHPIIQELKNLGIAEVFYFYHRPLAPPPPDRPPPKPPKPPPKPPPRKPPMDRGPWTMDHGPKNKSQGVRRKRKRNPNPKKILTGQGRKASKLSWRRRGEWGRVPAFS